MTSSYLDQRLSQHESTYLPDNEGLISAIIKIPQTALDPFFTE